VKRKLMDVLWVALIACLLISAAAYAQLPPSAKVLPPGFKAEGETNLGGTMVIDAKKPNENFPKPHMDQGIGLRITWQKQPAADMILDMLAKQAEEPAGRIPGSATREEPCGIQRYHDGVLLCRKVIIPWIGGGRGPDLVTWRIAWTGKAPGGLVSVEINNFYGAKETAIAWIDTIIPKITNPK
jgi:hypothetical protein